MNEENTVDAVVSKLKNSGPIYKYGHGIKIGDKSLRFGGFKLYMYENYTEDLIGHTDKELFVKKIYDKCLTFAKKDYEEKVDLAELSLLDADFQTNMESNKNVKVGIDATTGDWLAYDKNNYEIIDGLAAAALVKKLPHKQQAALLQNAPVIIQYFNPYKTTSPIKYSEHPKLKLASMELNQYRPPAYLGLEGRPILPPRTKQFLEYFFPVFESREYVYDWIHSLLTSKNETILYLVGVQGTGKNTLAEQLLGRLVGQEYQHTSEQNVTESQFNGFLRNKQLFFLDEFTAKTPKELNYIKKMTNKRVAVQAKFKDTEMRDSYLNLIIANNEMNAVRLGVGDRRISVPDIANKRIDKVLGATFVQEMIDKELNDEDILADIRSFFVTRKPKYTGSQPYQKERFLECCIKSLSDNMGHVYDILVDLRQERKPDIKYSAIVDLVKEAQGISYKPRNFPKPPTIFNTFKDLPIEGRAMIQDQKIDKHSDPLFILDKELLEGIEKELKDFKPEEQ